MQDYSKLYPLRYRSRPSSKLSLIKRIIRSDMPQTLMLAAIVLIVTTAARK